MTFTEINTSYAIKSNLAEQKYPALQVNNYRPATLKDTIYFCLSEDSCDLLSSEHNLSTDIVECYYGRESILMHQIIAPVRWIFLNIPRIFICDKNTKEISLPEKGVKLFGTNKVTIAKCFLACLNDEDLVLDIDGLPQIFTLKLTSSKTQLIGDLQNPENQTILSLNRELQKHLKTRDNLVHLVSVNLEANAREFVSNHSGDSSLGVNFELVGNAKVLSQKHQEQIFNLISNEEIQALFADPFGLKPENSSQGNRPEESLDISRNL